MSTPPVPVAGASAGPARVLVLEDDIHLDDEMQDEEMEDEEMEDDS